MLRVCRLASHKNNLITSDFEELVVIIIKATKSSSLLLVFCFPFSVFRFPFSVSRFFVIYFLPPIW